MTITSKTTSRFNGCLAVLCSTSALAVLLSPSRAASQSSIEKARNKMVDEEIVAAGVKNPRVIKSMRSTPRHEFCLAKYRNQAYYDMALPIGDKQTISPPFIVAYMTEQINPQATDKVLEIGTGSGYQAAVLSPLVKDVYTIEIVEPLGQRAARVLTKLKYDNVQVKIGDGYKGWPEHAPFDKIIVTCSPENVPKPLVDQLAEGGLMVIPVGERFQQTLYLYKKVRGKLTKQALRATLFVPMTGIAESHREVKPDPLNPSLLNGGFEQFKAQSKGPIGWHYQRQVRLVADKNAPEGKYYLTFKNLDAGRGSQMLQGFAIDGTKINHLEVSLKIKVDKVRPGQSAIQLPKVMITFYDKNRGPTGRAMVGPWRGSFDWRNVTKRVRVPSRAREAVMHIGLLGATGEMSLDAIQIKPTK